MQPDLLKLRNLKLLTCLKMNRAYYFEKLLKLRNLNASCFCLFDLKLEFSGLKTWFKLHACCFQVEERMQNDFWIDSRDEKNCSRLLNLIPGLLFENENESQALVSDWRKCSGFRFQIATWLQGSDFFWIWRKRL